MRRKSLSIGKHLRPGGHTHPARKMLSASISVALAALLFIAGIPGGLAPAVATGNTGTLTWDTRADFEQNASTTDATTTISGVSTQRTPGSVMLPGPVTAVAAGFSHTVGLASDGSVVAVGQNSFGQLDVAGWSDITTIAAGYYNTYGLKSDGTAVAVGYNSYGQLGVSGWSDIVAVAAGFHHAVGLKSDGTVVAIGSNDNNQSAVSGWSNIVAISAGAEHTVGLKSDGTVVQTGINWGDLSGWTDIVAIAAGSAHTVGLKSDGTVVAVGRNTYGECDVAGWTGITAVSTIYQHTVGLKSDGTLVAVGEDTGDGRCAVTSMDHITAIAAGGVHTAGLDYGGRVVSVGDNTSQQRNTQAWCDYLAVAAGGYHSLGLQSDGTVMAAGDTSDGKSNVSAWGDVVSIDAGSNHSVGVNSDGTVTAVGDNEYHQIEVNEWSDIVSASAGGRLTVGLKSDGTAVGVGDNTWGALNFSGWSDLVAVSAGDVHTVGLRSDGTAEAVGDNGYRQCNVSGWSGIAAVSAGAYHTVGLKADRTVVATGFNDYDQCNVSGWSDIVAVSAGDYHTIGLKSDGTVVATGKNDENQCDVSTWSDIVAISAGGFHSLGLKSDGTVVGVGLDGDGQTNTEAWASLTTATARVGSIGGAGAAVGLRAQAPADSFGWTTVGAETSALMPFQAVKFAVRTSADGITWSEPFGSDGDPIDWTSGSGNYLGRAVTDPSARTDLSEFSDAAYIDIVVRLEGKGTLAPELKSVTLGYATPLELPLGVTRVAGGTRYATGVAASVQAFPDGARTVVIATGANWPDALGGSALAGAAGGPLLLTAKDALPAEVTAEIARLKAKKVYILGGDTAVGAGVETALKDSLGESNVTRLAGNSRYETARKVADEVIALAQAGPGYDGVAYVATGANFPDALAVSPIAAATMRPVLLADPRTGEVSRPSAVTSVYILGGTSAVSASVETALRSAAGMIDVTRLFGPGRYETAAAIAAHGVAEGLSWDGVGIATGTKFPDGLSGGAMLGRIGSVMLLTPGTSLAPAAKTALEANAASIQSVFILGGTSAVSDAVAAAARTAAGL